MTKIRACLTDFLTCRSGATAIEYALIVGLMALALVGALTTVGEETRDGFQRAADSFPE